MLTRLAALRDALGDVLDPETIVGALGVAMLFVGLALRDVGLALTVVGGLLVALAVAGVLLKTRRPG